MGGTTCLSNSAWLVLRFPLSLPPETAAAKALKPLTGPLPERTSLLHAQSRHPGFGQTSTGTIHCFPVTAQTSTVARNPTFARPARILTASSLPHGQGPHNGTLSQGQASPRPSLLGRCCLW